MRTTKDKNFDFICAILLNVSMLLIMNLAFPEFYKQNHLTVLGIIVIFGGILQWNKIFSKTFNKIKGLL